MLVDVRGIGDYRVRRDADDAAGEAFDKTARSSPPYPGDLNRAVPRRARGRHIFPG